MKNLIPTRNLITAAAFALLAGNLSAQKTKVITFDNVPARDLSDDSPMFAPAGILRGGVRGYDGITWSGSAVLSPLLWELVDQAWVAAGGYPSDGTTVAFLGASTAYFFSRPGRPFNLNSFFMSALTTDPTAEPITIFASLAGVQKYSTTITPSTTSMDEFDFGWTNIDRVSISTAFFGRELIDNISITSATTATPEPVTLVLVASGFVAIAGKVRRRRSAAST